MTRERVARWTTWGTCITALAVGVVATWMAWFQHIVAVDDAAGYRVETHAANAWRASSTWTATAALALVAGVVAFAGARRRLEIRRATVAAALLSIAALVLCVWGRQAVVRDSRGSGTVGYVTYFSDEALSNHDADPDPYRVHRNALYLDQMGGYRAEFGPGVPLGIALLIGQSLLAAGAAAAVVHGSIRP